MSEDMLKLFQMMKMELEKQTTTITQNVTETLLHTIEDKIKPIIEENKQLKSEVEILNTKVKYLEDINRRKNFILHGIKETENTYDELFIVIKDILQNLSINIDKSEINRYQRLGKNQDGNKTRPILISFTSYLKKAEVKK